MGIPLVTPIWRGLAGMGNSLPAVWANTKPLYRSGAPQAALARVIERADLPLPAALAPTQLACVGVGAADLATIRTLVAAYNRSNGMNLVSMYALISAPDEDQAPEADAQCAPYWPQLPPLMARSAITDDTWSMVRQVNAYGAPGIDANVATLWRHLAYWPGFLALAHAALAAQHSCGAISLATEQVVALARQEGACLAHLRLARIEISRVARDTIAGYVTTPTQVVRMVTVGHALAKWLA
jgi:hypothetical protein